MQFPIQQKFKLTDSFIDGYKNKKAEFGFNGLGEFVYMRTYSRIKSDGKNESWFETVRRVVEGLYSIQRQHIEDYRLGWNQAKAQKSAQEMYDRIFSFKMLPPGRGLWAMGSSVVMERGLSEALFNCSFISTENLGENVGLPFANAMDFLMLGVGVGTDTAGAGKATIQPQKDKEHTYIIPDTREGWVESLRLLINSFFGEPKYTFDYTLIRKEGEPIKTFGGISSGSRPLVELHDIVGKLLSKDVGKPISARNIADIMNSVGRAVVSGNVRRSAEILLGNPNEEFLNLKNYEKNPERAEIGWASNNTIFGTLGMDYTDIVERIKANGEPGIFWLENARKYGRIRDSESDFKDKRVTGLNPCAEITLESGELCNLVEMFPNRHTDLEDFKKTIKFAYLAAKTVTLLNTGWSETNRVMLRNRRIGLSMTGIAQFIANHSLAELKDWMREGYRTAETYDATYSDWFAIPRSIKLTTIKPSGTVSLLAGATSGIHFPESQYYIRRVRLAANSPYVKILKRSKYKIEPAAEDLEKTLVVEFPVCVGENVKTINDVTMWEQLNLASFTQENWADNSVSVTVTFREDEAKDIATALNFFQFKLKAVSFLPKLEQGAYPQMPYEEITKEEYEARVVKLLPLDFSEMTSTESSGEKYCTNDVCSI